MPSEHARKCGHKAHNSRACGGNSCGGGGAFKLFGVQIDVAGGGSTIRKSKSLGNLEACSLENPAAGDLSGYLSDGYVHPSARSLERKKGRPWSEEEHRLFLVGLEKLGKGDWKGIATNYVPTRNSSQVASHAQKYFIRLSATEKRRRRQSVFDIPLTDANQSSQVTPGSQPDKAAKSSEPVTSWAASTNNTSESKGLASTNIPPVKTSERPPLSPMNRRGNPDVRGMVYAPRVSGLGQGLSAQAFQPTVAWVPFVTFSNQNSVILPNIHGALAPNCAKFVGQPSIGKFPQSTQMGSSEAGVVPPAANDELNLNIRKLTL
ncbi:myb-like transcription factor family protein [Striga hermonthica]|uniref:Myb-like transcription factor family protein n=1 Tax=Striga hermonthica TaxID=68872 RepID=A0A9N7NSE8_STRHE|nr:myb-like transcription factor family protein [Striga hermonthica]